MGALVLVLVIGEAKMTNRIVVVPTTMLAKLAAVFILVVGGLCVAHAAWSVTAKSGEPIEVMGGGHYRVDANGKEWPVRAEILTQPKNGHVTTQTSSGQRTLKNGEVRTVRLARVVYQSNKGFVGEDSFTYRYITADPTDTYNGKEIAVAVTVR
jgi:hypothetical protein